MLYTVYYITHLDTQEKVRYYKTRAGARIAQHARNSHVGFKHRIERIELYDNCEVEQYLLPDGTVVSGTYCIVEDTVEQTDLYIGPAAG
jgi:hypothetical protein